MLLAAPAVVSAIPVQAQSVQAQSTGVPVVSREVVQPLPAAGTGTLNSALQRLAANPRDTGALVDAGFAALEIGDVDAAVGFFSRADAISPGIPRAQAGLGAAYVRSENPYDALLRFEEAEKGGVAPVTMAGDRGLAYDLVGDAASAQLYYRQALALKPDAEITRRLAISQAISGDGKAADATLLPLLKKQDLAAYRARAFVLAIQGDTKGAQEIADQVMPREMAGKIAPYLRYMPRLTAAQQAAAANFGQFPRAADIGKDDPRAARYSGNVKRPQVASAAPQSALVPAGEPFGRKAESEKRAKPAQRNQAQRDQKAERQVVAATPTPTPALVAPITRSPSNLRAPESGELPPVAGNATAVASAAIAPVVQNPPAPVAPSPPVAAQASVAAPVATPPHAAVMASAPASAAVAVAPASPPAFTAAPSYPTTPAVAGGEAAIASFGTGPQIAQMGVIPPAPSAAPASQLSATPVQAALAASAAPLVAEAAVSAAPALPAADPVAALAVVDQPAAEPVQPAPAAPPEPLPQRLADAFADFSLPAAVPRAPGAVDITKITPRRETSDKDAADDPKAVKDPKAQKDAKAQADAKAKKDAKPKPPAQPSRAWVQVATGRDLKALAFDWRRMSKAQAALFKGQQPYTAKWGQTNRLLTGPFPSASAAQDYVSKLKKAGVNSFTFTSDEGEEVSALKAGS